MSVELSLASSVDSGSRYVVLTERDGVVVGPERDEHGVTLAVDKTRSRSRHSARCQKPAAATLLVSVQ